MYTISRHRRDDADLDPRVAAVLAAAAAPTEPGPVPGEEEALAAFRAAVPMTRRTRMLPSIKAAAIAATATGALLTGGVAAAASGTLPGTAQDTAKTILGTVGVTVPGPSENAADNSTTRGRSADAHARNAARTAAAAEDTAAPTTAANEHGKAVSSLATTTELTGRDKGAAISELASNGKSKAGDEHPTPTETVTPEATETPTTTTGQSTAATASSGHSTEGRAHHTP